MLSGICENSLEGAGSPAEMDTMIDKEFSFNGPCGCGQIAVNCSVRMIVERRSFFCEACGFEFSGSEFPDFLELAGKTAMVNQDLLLFSDMKRLYAFFYGTAGEISQSVVSRVLKGHPEYFDQFPLAQIPGEMIVERLGNDRVFAENFLEIHAPFCQPRNFTPRDWIALFARIPGAAVICDAWNEFTPKEWEQIRKMSFSVYDEYFTMENLGRGNYLKCIASEPALLTKTFRAVANAVKKIGGK